MYEELRLRLEQERQRIIKELAQLKALTPTIAESLGEVREQRDDRVDDAIAGVELEKRLALEDNLRNLLADIEHALSKFDSGSYGLCDRCGQPIDPQRLQALPQANLCISCKALQAKDVKGRYPRK